MIRTLSVADSSSTPANAALELRRRASIDTSYLSLARQQQEREEKERLHLKLLEQQAQQQKPESLRRRYRLSAEVARERQTARTANRVAHAANATHAVEFVWPYEGKQVYVCGSFGNWMARMPMNKEGDAWKLTLDLYAGTHQYKFIVDDVWCYDVAQPTRVDAEGNTNNFIRV